MQCSPSIRADGKTAAVERERVGFATPAFSSYLQSPHPLLVLPSVMTTRIVFGLGLLAGVLLLGVSCTGPSPDEARPDETEEDRARVYQVQLNMTREKEKANRLLGRALEWWKARSETRMPRPLTPSGASPVTMTWRAPLYRVQIGPFASRAQADSVLRTAQTAFPGAFVRPARPSSQP